ncbi:MAG: helix-turn-helix domain-containing protein [Candidatus Dormibacteraceae bacterium]
MKKIRANGDRMVLRVEEVHELLGISQWTIYEMIRRGELPALRIGRLLRIPRPALEEWVAARTTGCTEKAA